MTAKHRRFFSSGSSSSPNSSSTKSKGIVSSNKNNNNRNSPSSNICRASSQSSIYSCTTSALADLALEGESEFVAKFAPNPTTIMNSKSSATHATSSTTLMSDLHLGGSSDSESHSSSYNDDPSTTHNTSGGSSFFHNLGLSSFAQPSTSASSSQQQPQQVVRQPQRTGSAASTLSNASGPYIIGGGGCGGGRHSRNPSRDLSLSYQHQQESFDFDERSEIECPLNTLQPYVTTNTTQDPNNNQQQKQKPRQQQQKPTAAIDREIPIMAPYVVKSKEEQLHDQQVKKQWQEHQKQQQLQQELLQSQKMDDQEKLRLIYEKQRLQYQQQLSLPPPSSHQQHQQSAAAPSSKKKPLAKPTGLNQRMTSHRLPRVTKASAPFEKMIAPTSYLHDELTKDEAYNHAIKCGVVWQSLVGQFVKFPSLWYDGEEPSRPYLGCPSKANKWSFFGRHRIPIDPNDKTNLLRKLVRDEFSSGKLVLHVIVIDSDTNEPKEDLIVGVFHPNSKGIRPISSNADEYRQFQRNDNCRDIWIGHRSRRIPVNGRRHASKIESLLHYLNKQSVDKSPLGPKNDRGIPYHVDNTNMNGIFGRNPPRSTIFVPENKLYKLLEPPSSSSSSSSQPSSRSTSPSPAPSSGRRSPDSPKMQRGGHRRTGSYGNNHHRRTGSSGGGGMSGSNHSQQQQSSYVPQQTTPASVTLMKAFIGSYTEV